MNEVRLGDATGKIGSGATPRGGDRVYLVSGVPFVRSQNIYNDGFNPDGLVFIDDEHAEELDHVTVHRGDNLVDITGESVGRTCLVPNSLEGARVSQHVAIVRARPDCIVPRFLHYALISPTLQAELHSLAAAGATRKALTKSMLEDLRIPCPTLSEQHAIASALGSLDDKIELNRRMNQTLEEICRTLFRFWFVDFGPVRAKAEGSWKKGETLPGMPADMWDLWPSEFEESEIGEIPKGWEVKPISSILEVNPQRQLVRGQVAPYVEMGQLSTSGARVVGWVPRPFTSGSRFRNGDTLVARITPCLENGKTAHVDFLVDGQVGWGSTEFLVLGPRLPLPPQWVYLLARTESFRSHLIQNMSGTSGRQRAPADSLRSFLVASPSPGVAKAFGSLVAPLFEPLKQNDSESTTLAAMRDSLLPKLLSGELRVQGAEAV